MAKSSGGTRTIALRNASGSGGGGETIGLNESSQDAARRIFESVGGNAQPRTVASALKNIAASKQALTKFDRANPSLTTAKQRETRAALVAVKGNAKNGVANARAYQSAKRKNTSEGNKQIAAAVKRQSADRAALENQVNGGLRARF